jgi:hypothetical protein
MDQNKVHRTYMRRFVIAMSIYIILLLGVSTLVGYLPAGQWNILLSILPAIPLVYALWAYGHFLNGIDELQRLIHTRSIALAAGMVGIGTFTYGLLQSFADFPAINLVWVLPLLIAIWGTGLSYYGRQYNE